MGIDIRSTRRTKFYRCNYYSNQYTKQEILDRDATKLGIFYAIDQTGVNYSKNDLGGVVRRDLSTITIETEDDVQIKADYWVEFSGELYIVTSVNVQKQNKNYQFSNRPIVKTTITMRK